MLGGDKRVDYGRVNQVLGLLQQAGVVKVGLMSQPETSVVPAGHGKR
jgi:biopolymer transport protein TolR